jgi:hypothetical protein
MNKDRILTTISITQNNPNKNPTTATNGGVVSKTKRLIAKYAPADILPPPASP